MLTKEPSYIAQQTANRIPRCSSNNALLKMSSKLFEALIRAV